MAKIAYNRCFGGFGLSHAAVMRYAELKGLKLYAFVADYSSSRRDAYRPFTEADNERQPTIHYCTTPEFSNESYWSEYTAIREGSRHDPDLIKVIEELGEKANGFCAKLAIAELPAGTLYRIDEYDGRESVETNSSYEWVVAA
jgi:hypothetical protein